MQDNISKAFGGYEFEWDSTIEKDSEFVLLPEGDYNFEILSFQRGRHNGSERLPECNKAILEIQLTSDDGKLKSKVTHNLFLHSTCEGMLCAFFTAIGQRSHGQRITMNWNLVTGSKGRCKVTIRKWTNRNTGAEMQGNQISRFYEPQIAPEQKSEGNFTPGRF